MKLSNEKIVNIINSIGGLSTKQLPVKASYAISKNILKLEKEIKTYNSEREKLLDKYAEKDDEGKRVVNDTGNIIIDKQYVEKWNKDIRELLDIEIEIDVHKFNISVLDGCNISTQELMLIDFMIEE